MQKEEVGFGEYMTLKIKKLRNQVGNDAEIESEIFKSVVIYVNGK